MTQQQKDFLKLIKSGLTGEKEEISSEFEFDKSIAIAKKHQVLSILYEGIKKSNIDLDSVIESNLSTESYKNMVVDCQQIYELEELKKLFTEYNIDFAILKGSHLKSYFPKSYMRLMNDIDILIGKDGIELAKQLVSKRGYEFETETDHVVEWRKGKCLYLELHKKLIPSNEMFGSYYNNCWELFKLKENSKNEYYMNLSDEYIFLFLHFVKHYISGGVGIRQMIDLWMFSEKEKNIDFDYICSQLKNIGLVEFWENICKTLDCWMNFDFETEKTNFITDFIFSNGVFGNSQNYVIANAVKSNENPTGAGMRKIINVFFLPYSGMCLKFPKLERFPWLLPYYWVKRWILALLNKKSIAKSHLKNYLKMNSKDIKAAKSAYEYVGLGFDFKE